MLKISLSSGACLSGCEPEALASEAISCSVSKTSTCCSKKSDRSDQSPQDTSDCSCHCCSITSFVTVFEAETEVEKDLTSIILPEPDYYWVSVDNQVFHPPCEV